MLYMCIYIYMLYMYIYILYNVNIFICIYISMHIYLDGLLSVASLRKNESKSPMLVLDGAQILRGRDCRMKKKKRRATCG